MTVERHSLPAHTILPFVGAGFHASPTAADACYCGAAWKPTPILSLFHLLIFIFSVEL